MNLLVFERSDKGQEQVIRRNYNLPSRQRVLLLLLHGRQSITELSSKAAELGLGADAIYDLLDQGFIRIVSLEQTPVPASHTIMGNTIGLTNAWPVVTDDYLPVWTPLSDDEPLLQEGQTQVEGIYHFFTNTIKSVLGLRGFTLQLKVERAVTLEDFRCLRRPYLDAVLRIKGKEVERGLRRHLDTLLYMNDISPYRQPTMWQMTGKVNS